MALERKRKKKEGYRPLFLILKDINNQDSVSD
jgi:hypothetical protein